MKRTFGNALSRLLWNGTTPTEVEFQLLQQLVASLPAALREVVEAQFAAYNLVQREVDGRALNFYRKTRKRASNMDGLPLLEMTIDEAPLARLTAQVTGERETVHATLNAVRGRVFCMALSRPLAANGTVTVSEIKQAWRSNFHDERA